MLSDTDERRRKEYPVFAFKRKLVTKMCSVCNRSVAEWECHGDRLADSSPCHLCDVCHFRFHYDADGTALRTDYKIFKMFQAGESYL